ncbi:MAG: hypothetical protein WAU88_10910 [Candidatus Zixiibacteriota bacterium]
MNRRVIFATALYLALLATAAIGQTANRTRTFTGTYTCIACNLSKSIGAHAQCDTYGHDFGVKLSDGSFVHFMLNDHSADLVKGGGRTEFPITVTGAYDRSSRTLDVEKYAIDGVESTWSPESGKMVSAVSHQKMLTNKVAPTEKPDEKLTKK